MRRQWDGGTEIADMGCLLLFSVNHKLKINILYIAQYLNI